MVVAGVMLMSACVGVEHLGVLDESIPEEQQCLLEVRDNMRVVMFNNQPVDWYPGGLTKDKVTIYVPPGDNNFVVTYVVSSTYGGMTTYSTISKNVGMEFLPGHSYRIYMQKIWLLIVTIRNVKIKEIPVK
jgi:hypothetical protein